MIVGERIGAAGGLDEGLEVGPEEGFGMLKRGTNWKRKGSSERHNRSYS